MTFKGSEYFSISPENDIIGKRNAILDSIPFKMF